MVLCKMFGLAIVSLICLNTNIVSAQCSHGELYPNAVDCQLFYHCSHGILYELSCPDGLHFNTNISVCDYPSNVNCEIVIDPTVPPKWTTPDVTTTTPNLTTTTSTTPPPPLHECTDFCGHYVGSSQICPQFDLGMEWSHTDTIPGKDCIHIDEPLDPHDWHNNFLCFNNDYGVRWSHSAAIDGMNCTRIFEVADPNSWDDNFLCVPHSSPFQFRFSSSASIPGLCCVQMNEPADPHTWQDNYLCVSE